MGWSIVLSGVIVILMASAFVIDRKRKKMNVYADPAFTIGSGLLSGVILVFFMLPIFCIMCFSYPEEINTYTQQKSYIESHIAKSDVEDAALTAKKIELNGWLYEAQYSKGRYGAFSLWGDEILTLTPIE